MRENGDATREKHDAYQNAVDVINRMLFKPVIAEDGPEADERRGGLHEESPGHEAVAQGTSIRGPQGKDDEGKRQMMGDD